MLDLARSKALTEITKRKKARRGLLAFTKYTMPGFEEARHHELICDKLDAVERGDIKRLMIFTPPRHTKSELVSRRFPAYYLGRNPGEQFVVSSYGADLAQEFGRDVRNLIASDEYSRIFPATQLAADSTAKDRWHTTFGGIFVAVGVGGGLTGKGGHVCVIDDPVKDRLSAESPVTRQRIWDWYRSVLRTRLMPEAAIILVMTRWHPEDLAGQLIDAMHSGGEQWEIINLPAISTAPDDPIGRQLGEPLWPAWYGAGALKAIEASVGPREWSALYQQEPVSGGEFFSASAFLVNDQPVPIPTSVLYVFASVDTTQKGGKGRDGTGASYWAMQELKIPGQYPLTLLDWDLVEHEGGLLDIWFPQVFARLEELAKITKARTGSIGAFVEDKAAGSILLQQAPRHNWPMHPIDSKLTSVGKDARAINASGYINQNLVKITAPAFIKQLPFHGATRNHWLAQMTNYRVGQDGEGREDDLFDTATYGIALSLGNAAGF